MLRKIYINFYIKRCTTNPSSHLGCLFSTDMGQEILGQLISGELSYYSYYNLHSLPQSSEPAQPVTGELCFECIGTGQACLT